MEFSTLNGYKVKDSKAIRYYDTVALMKADTSLKDGMHVKTKGYYSVNDGGESEYHITNTQSETEYQEELNSTLYATLIIENDSINIKQLGAYGDGTHDDTNSFKAFASSNVTKLIVPNGTYNLTDILDFTNKDIEGIGSPVLDYISQTTSREHFIKFHERFNVENITFNQSINNTDTVGVFDCSFSRFSNCKFIAYEVKCGSELDLYTNNHDILIENCYFNLKSYYENTMQEGGIWVREHESDKESYNIAFNDCVMNHESADEVIAVWNWVGLVHHVELNNCKIIGGVNNTAPWFITFNIDNSSINNSYIENKRTTNFSGLFNFNENISYDNISVNNCIIKTASNMSNGLTVYKLTFNNCNIYNTSTTTGNFLIDKNTIMKNCNVTAKKLQINGGSYYNTIFTGDGTQQEYNPIIMNNATSLVLDSCAFNNFNFNNAMFIYLHNDCDSIILRNTKINFDMTGITYLIFGGVDVANLVIENSIMNRGVYITGTVAGYIANNITNRTINAFSNVKVNNNFNITE